MKNEAELTLAEAERLRRRFYDGTSTRDEERRLARFVESDGLPASWQTDREVLRALTAAAGENTPSLPEGFEQRVRAALAGTPDASPLPLPGATARRSRRPWRAALWAGAAAAVLTLALLPWGREAAQPAGGPAPVAGVAAAAAADSLPEAAQPQPDRTDAPAPHPQRPGKRRRTWRHDFERRPEPRYLAEAAAAPATAAPEAETDSVALPEQGQGAGMGRDELLLCYLASLDETDRLAVADYVARLLRGEIDAGRELATFEAFADDEADGTPAF